MNSFLKDNIVNIVVFLAVFIIIIIGVYNANSMAEHEKQSALNVYNTYCVDTTEEYPVDCDEILNLASENKSFFYYLTWTWLDTVQKYTYVIIVLIAVAASYYVTKYLKSNIILNEVTRQSYKDSVLKLFKKTHITSLILPLSVLFLFTIIICISSGFTLTTGESTMSELYTSFCVNHPIIYMITFLLYVLFLSAYYVNCCLIVARKSNNLFLTVILSILLMLGIEIFFEVVVSNVISALFNSDIGSLFNTLNILNYNLSYGYLTPLIFTFLLSIITFLIVCILYKNKEKLIISKLEGEEVVQE